MESPVPASARLLQKLREAWGEEVTQDLVTWVNEAQTVNRAELRELADLYFARFGDRLEARVALTDARFSAMLDERLAASQAKLEARMDERIAASEVRFDAKLDARISEVRLEIAGLRGDVAAQMRDQMKWMFVFWMGTVVPLAGLIVALGKAWL